MGNLEREGANCILFFSTYSGKYRVYIVDRLYLEKCRGMVRYDNIGMQEIIQEVERGHRGEKEDIHDDIADTVFM